MVSERLAKIRERVNRREKKVRADRQAKSRRIERGEPDSAGEKAQVKFRSAKNEGKMSAEEARELATDAKTLVATELGISPSESKGVIKKGAALLDEAGGSISQLDIDGDGDTDLLNGLDFDSGGGAGSSGSGDGDVTDAIFGGSSGSNTSSSSGNSDGVFDPFEDGPQ